jgi:hypothetical protein
MSTTRVPSATKAAQVSLNRVTDSNCRVVLDNPPLNLIRPEFVWQIRQIVTTLENDDQLKTLSHAQRVRWVRRAEVGGSGAAGAGAAPAQVRPMPVYDNDLGSAARS